VGSSLQIFYCGLPDVWMPWAQPGRTRPPQVKASWKLGDELKKKAPAKKPKAPKAEKVGRGEIIRLCLRGPGLRGGPGQRWSLATPHSQPALAAARAARRQALASSARSSCC
jgi:hypothetical protein